MRRLRRLNTGTVIELTPMIDVVFLLLTFFIFSVALMVRADVLGVSLPELTSGAEAERVEPVTVTLRADGTVRVMGEAVERERLVDAVRAARDGREDAPVLLAADVDAGAGALIELADALVGAGITQFSVVGRPAADDGAESGGAEGAGSGGAGGGTP
jgi:biopolymer transport protein ExbD